jgi:hypothetical protein
VEDLDMRVIGIVLLAITLAGTGDRIKQGMNPPEERPPSLASWSIAQITNMAA